VADRIDETDAELLNRLQQDGRISHTALAEAVDLSVPAVSERLRKLGERGVLAGHHATVDAKRVGFDITAFMRVDIRGSEHYPGFLDTVTAFDAVLEVHSVTGGGSHMLKVRTETTTELERLLSEIQQIEGVRSTSSSIVLSTFKETRALPVEPVELADAEVGEQE
jgi:Lrp/AsnC family leucine-responsive transcriptional regulator